MQNDTKIISERIVDNTLILLKESNGRNYITTRFPGKIQTNGSLELLEKITNLVNLITKPAGNSYKTGFTTVTPLKFKDVTVQIRTTKNIFSIDSKHHSIHNCSVKINTVPTKSKDVLQLYSIIAINI
jgi:hypothetical protein